MSGRLASLGFALPEPWRQEDLAAALADAWRLGGAERERWKRIVRGSGIERRHVVADLASTIRLGTAARMAIFEREAPSLAERAAREALAAAGRRGDEVTDCIVVTCTGFAAPGVGAAIAPRLGLRRTVRHTQIGFMGCFGAILGLRAAMGAVAADPGAVALVVCVELCSLHVRPDGTAQDQVGAALFADGAAAAVVDRAEGSRQPGIAALDLGRSLLVGEAAEAMTWRIGDHGFAMTLSREVPEALRRELGAFLGGDAAGSRLAPLAHPGGPAILDAVERALAGRDVDPRAIASSREILRTHGNMSSGSVLFVLDAFRRAGGTMPAQLVAFGPGLTIDAVGLGPAT